MVDRVAIVILVNLGRGDLVIPTGEQGPEDADQSEEEDNTGSDGNRN